MPLEVAPRQRLDSTPRNVSCRFVELVQCLDKPLNIDIPRPDIKNKGVPIGQLAERDRQLARRGHPGAVDEYRNHVSVPFECDFELESNKVLRVVNPALAAVGLDKPLSADYSEHDPKRPDALPDRFGEVHARRDAVDVD